jgi:hypothetical protein
MADTTEQDSKRQPGQSRLVTEDGYIVNLDCDGWPVLFLDCDGVLAEVNGGPLDESTVSAVSDTLRLAGACVVLCSDRVRDPDFYEQVVSSGIARYRLRGQCDPDETGGPRSSKVARVLRWLELAEEHGACPSAWCVLDDARTFAHDWRTATQHVRPAGKLVGQRELDRVWSLLSRRLPR